MASTAPANPTAPDPRKSLLLVLAVGVLCGVLASLAGWFSGGEAVARAAGAGAACAAVGGIVAWAVVALVSGPGASAMTGPMIGLMVRVAVTGVCVGFVVLALGFDRGPVLFAALFGYLMLMATESVLLYRFASSAKPSGRHTPTHDAEQAVKHD